MELDQKLVSRCGATGVGVSQVVFTVRRRGFDGLDARDDLSQVGEGRVGTGEHLEQSDGQFQLHLGSRSRAGRTNVG